MPDTTLLAGLSDARRLQLLVDGVIDYAIYLIDLDGRVASWNSGARRLKGYEAGEIIGSSFTRFYTDEDQKAGKPQRILATARAAGRVEDAGWRVRKDGSRFWAFVIIDAVRDETGELIGYAKVTRDITERQDAQKDLAESTSDYRRLVEAVVDYAIFQLDPNGIVSTWNAGAQRIKGYAPREIIGKHFSQFYTQKDRDAGVPDKALETAAEEGRYEAEGLRVRKDGSEFWALVVIDPIRNEQGEIIGFAKVTRDVTERHNAELRLQEAQEQLALAQKMDAIGQLSGGIAHDFNNLLMIVLGNLDTAHRHAQKLQATNIIRSLNNATRGAQRAVALTSRLLAFSRRQALDPKIIDPTRFITDSVDFLQRSLGEMIQIEAVGSAGLWHIEADPNQLESALVNLAINARDAMPNGGKLTIEAANVLADEEYSRRNPEVPPGQYVVICVTDTGSGMTPDILNHVFEPFFTTKEVGHGTGLGLSQVYGFVKQSGGNVKIYSEPGQGTTVKIYLPRAHGGSADDEFEDAGANPEGDLNETILVVEDNTELRTYLAEVLRGLKYRVMTAADSQAALSVLARRDDIDLLLTDIVMPGSNGRELAEIAQKLHPSLKVLYMTGYSRNAVVHQGRLEEGLDVLQKPVSQSLLASRIRELLDQPSAK